MSWLSKFRIQKPVDLLSSSRELQQAGHWEQAFRLLQNQPEDAALEREAVDILLRALQTQSPVATPPAHTAPKPQLPTMAAGAAGIPEIGADDLNADILRGSMAEHGYLLVRGLIDSTRVEALTNAIDQSLQQRAAAHAPGANSKHNSPWYYPSPHFPGNHVSYANRNASNKYSATGSMPVIDSPRGCHAVLDVFHQIELGDVLHSFFGEEGVIAARKWMFRLAAAQPDTVEGIGGGWHQDGQFMGERINTLNLWIALTPCGDGTDAPGIALIPRRFSELLEFGTRGALGLDRWPGPCRGTRPGAPHGAASLCGG